MRLRQTILPARKRHNDRIYPLARAFYADPFIDMHNRMKEALVLLGRLPRANVRPPLIKLSAGRSGAHRCSPGDGRPAARAVVARGVAHDHEKLQTFRIRSYAKSRRIEREAIQA